MDTALIAIIGKYDCHFRVIKILEKLNIYTPYSQMADTREKTGA